MSRRRRAKTERHLRERRSWGPPAVAPWTPFEKATFTKGPPPDEHLDPRYRDAEAAGETWVNSRFQVTIFRTATEWGEAVHLSIKNQGKDARHDWRDFQRLKNELVGPEREAVEVYPAESRLVDTVDQFHLWVLPEGERCPFGFDGRLVAEEIDPEGFGSQRPFEEKPGDLASHEQLKEFGRDPSKEDDWREAHGWPRVEAKEEDGCGCDPEEPRAGGCS